jgi:hypothetical protein
MKKVLLLLFLLPLLAAAQQENKTLLVVPLHKDNIHLSNLIKKNLNYNRVAEDSLLNYVVGNLNAQVKSIFKGYSVHFWDKNFSGNDVTLKLWSCFYRDLATENVYNLKNTQGSKESYHNLYYGVELSPQMKEDLLTKIQSLNCDYVLFLNEFEVGSGSTFSLSCEVMNNKMEKIYGNKKEIEEDVVRNMYYDVLKFYVRETEEKILMAVKDYLNNKK